MTTVITKATPPDLLAALPALVGRDPSESVVLLAFRGKRTHAALRFDIPSTGFARFATTMAGVFSKIEGVDGVVPVVCSGTPLASHRALIAALVRRLTLAGFDVRDALVVGSDGWGSHFDPDLPRRGRPLSDIEEAAVRLALDRPVDIPERVPRAHDLACRRMADDLERLRMLAAHAHDSGELDDPDDRDDLGELDQLADLPFFAENALEWNADQIATHGGLLAFALQGPPARDLVMLQWAFGLDLGDALWSGDTCHGMQARTRYPNLDAHAAELLLGHGDAPDVERIEAGIALLTDLVSRLADAERPPLLCMLAWLNWALGRGSAAGAHLDEVHSIAPDYGMGAVLAGVLNAGMLPDWVFGPRPGVTAEL